MTIKAADKQDEADAWDIWASRMKEAADGHAAIARLLNALRGSTIPVPAPAAPQPTPVTPIGTIQTTAEVTGCMWSWLTPRT